VGDLGVHEENNVVMDLKGMAYEVMD